MLAPPSSHGPSPRGSLTPRSHDKAKGWPPERQLKLVGAIRVCAIENLPWLRRAINASQNPAFWVTSIVEPHTSDYARSTGNHLAPCSICENVGPGSKPTLVNKHPPKPAINHHFFFESAKEVMRSSVVGDGDNRVGKGLRGFLR
jgi:hypothetical protein